MEASAEVIAVKMSSLSENNQTWSSLGPKTKPSACLTCLEMRSGERRGEAGKRFFILGSVDVIGRADPLYAESWETRAAT